MKLLKTQYDDMVKEFDTCGITSDRILFVKKKGRIKITIAGFASHFEFFRRKSITLSESHQWEKSEYYELNIAGKPLTAANWTEVMISFADWLKRNS